MESKLKALSRGGLLAADQILLLEVALKLITLEKQRSGMSLGDYGYIVFPAAKAYEGFLKNFFYQLGLMSTSQYREEHFRIGKALNPDLPYRYRNDSWLYDDLVRACNQELAEILWQTWKSCRNEIFHYFPDDPGLIDFIQAQAKVSEILSAMEAACQCEVALKRDGDFKG